jgi:hypothetical protein
LAGGGVGGVGDDLAVVVDRGRPFSVPICVVVLSAVAPITVPQRLFVPHTDKMRTRAEGLEDEDEIAWPGRAATPPQADAPAPRVPVVADDQTNSAGVDGQPLTTAPRRSPGR